MKDILNRNNVRGKLTQATLIAAMILASCTSAVAPNRNATPVPTEKIVSTTLADGETLTIETITPDALITQTPANTEEAIPYSPINTAGDVEGIGAFPFSIALSEGLQKRPEAPITSININRAYEMHTKYLEEFVRPIDGNNSPEDTFSTYLQKLLWVKHISDFPSDKDMTFEEYAADPDAHSIKIMVAKSNSVELAIDKPKGWKEKTIVPTKINIVAVDKIYGLENINNQPVFEGTTSTPGVHVEESNGEITTYFIPCSEKDIEDLYYMDKNLGLTKDQSRDKAFMISLVNALQLALDVTTREDIKRAGHYDWSTSVSRASEAYRNASFETDDLYFRQGYRWWNISAEALKDGTDESDATPLFEINH